MPLFEYVCGRCSHEFEALVFGGQAPACPKCGSRELEQTFSTFAMSQGSAGGRSAATPSGGSCGPTGG